MKDSHFSFADVANIIYRSKRRVGFITNRRRQSLQLEDHKGTTADSAPLHSLNSPLFLHHPRLRSYAFWLFSADRLLAVQKDPGGRRVPAAHRCPGEDESLACLTALPDEFHSVQQPTEGYPLRWMPAIEQKLPPSKGISPITLKVLHNNCTHLLEGKGAFYNTYYYTFDKLIRKLQNNSFKSKII